MTYFKNKNLFEFRLNLLKTVLLMAFTFSLFIATLAFFNIFPLDKMYMLVLYAYGLIHLFVYLLIKSSSTYFFMAINIIIVSSLFTFAVMTITVLHDEFRLVWFFLTAFGAFILGGKNYGIIVTLLISLIVISLYTLYEINLSPYAIFTFFAALIMFNTFAFYFLRKIENDAIYLEKKVIEEVEKQQIQEEMLLRQYRMVNMGEMIDAIAHQWRQPLMQNSMMLLNLYDAIEDDEFDKEYVLNKIERLSSVTSHMSQTIEDFRKLLQNDKEVSTFAVDESIKEVLALLKNNLKEIEVVQTKTNFAVLGLKSEFVQVLIILISNAIEVLNEKALSSEYIYIGLEKEDDCIKINIEDNAGGIDEIIMGKIFDPYFSTKQVQGGTGLGLYIAKIIVEQNMKGQLNVSNTSKGAKFQIKLEGG